MKTRRDTTCVLLAACATWAVTSAAQAAVYDVTIDGPDAIWLAGRTDIVVPPASDPWPGGLLRHGGNTPEEALETIPSFVAVAGGDVVRALDAAVGGVNFFNGFGPPFFGPNGNESAGSNLTAFGGISGYVGPQGPLTGVFLTDAIPSAGPPGTLDFSSAASREFTSLTPAIGQIFYIGDGKTSADVFQQFIAPAGATRLFLAIPDGFGFAGAPGAYDDNDGSYQIRIGVNEVPVVPGIPEPETYALMLAGLAALGIVQRRRRK